MTPARTATVPIARGCLGRGLVVVWALLLALVAVPCAAMADADAACGHCAGHAMDGQGMDGQHSAETCLHCGSDGLAGSLPAEDRGPGASIQVGAPIASAVLVAEAPVMPFPTAEPRPPTTRPYLITRRLRL